jgi:hypothetical protein
MVASASVDIIGPSKVAHATSRMRMNVETDPDAGHGPRGRAQTLAQWLLAEWDREVGAEPAHRAEPSFRGKIPPNRLT